MFGSDSKLVFESEYDTFVDSLKAITVVEAPENMGLNTRGVALLYVENAISLPVIGWKCVKHSCTSLDGQFTVSPQPSHLNSES